MNPDHPYFWPRMLAACVFMALLFWTPRLRAKTKAAPQPLDVAEMIEAIADVESGNKAGVAGKHGERGRCQFMPETWRRYTNAEFLLFAPVDCQLTRKVERAHLSYICGFLAKRRIALEPAIIAAAWRFGEENAVKQARADSSRRTANVYFARVEAKQRALAAARKGAK
jgi:hypothetical protein